MDPDVEAQIREHERGRQIVYPFSLNNLNMYAPPPLPRIEMPQEHFPGIPVEVIIVPPPESCCKRWLKKFRCWKFLS